MAHPHLAKNPNQHDPNRRSKSPLRNQTTIWNPISPSLVSTPSYDTISRDTEKPNACNEDDQLNKVTHQQDLVIHWVDISKPLMHSHDTDTEGLSVNTKHDLPSSFLNKISPRGPINCTMNDLIALQHQLTDHYGEESFEGPPDPMKNSSKEGQGHPKEATLVSEDGFLPVTYKRKIVSMWRAQ